MTGLVTSLISKLHCWSHSRLYGNVMLSTITRIMVMNRPNYGSTFTTWARHWADASYRWYLTAWVIPVATRISPSTFCPLRWPPVVYHFPQRKPSPSRCFLSCWNRNVNCPQLAYSSLFGPMQKNTIFVQASQRKIHIYQLNQNNNSCCDNVSNAQRLYLT